MPETDQFKNRTRQSLIEEIQILKQDNLRLKNECPNAALQDLSLACDNLRKYRALIDLIPYGIAELDMEGKIILSNRAHHKLHGYQYGEILGKYIHDFQPNEQGKQELKNHFATIIREQPEPTPIFSKNITQDNHIIDIRVDWDYLRDKEKLVTGIVAVVTDITRPKKAFKEADSLANVIRQSTDSIVLTNLAGDITYVNPSFQKTTGYQMEEVLGKNPRILKSENSPYEDSYYKNMWQTLERGEVWSGEFVNRRKNGEDYIEEVSIFPVREGGAGEITGYGAIKKDITMNRKLEESLVNSYDEVLHLKEKAEGANRLKSTFLATMSHDIRTPLHAIIGFTDLLLKKERRDYSQETLKKISAAGEGLLQLIDDILDFSKIEAGQMDIHKKPFLLNDLMQDLTTIFENQFKKKSLGFRMNLTQSVPAMVSNDRWRLNQVLTNLLSNAVKFTDSGEVSIYCTYRDLSDLLLFRVSDTGIGIADANLETIFDAFSQVRHPDSTTNRGTGLGLAICKKLMHLMGGTITVHSTPGEGTVFNLELPANSHDLQQPPPVINKIKPLTDLHLKKENTILVAEDNPVNLELLMEQLQDAGFNRVLVARNGREAVDRAMEHQPDLVLMDLQMPVMGGLEAIVLMKEMGFVKPIVALSAYAMQDDIEKTLNSGAAGYITKPIDFKTFFNKIGNYLTPSSTGTQTKASQINKKNGGSALTGKREADAVDEDFILKGTVSQRLKILFLSELKKKLAILNAIADTGQFEQKRETIKTIAHGYRGNAAIFGLNKLESVASQLDSSIKEGKLMELLIPLIQKLIAYLERIIKLNSNFMAGAPDQKT